MDKLSTKKMALNGVMIALVFLTTMFTRIPGPIPPGYINFGDAVIIVTAVLLGKNSGFIAGAFGSALADIAAPGGIIFAPVTFIIKGLEGYLVGKIISDKQKEIRELREIKGQKESKELKRKYELKKVFAIIVGTAVMVIGYFIAELTILRLFDPTFGYAAAIAELPFNLIQGGVSAVLGYLLSTLLQNAGIEKYLE